MFSILIASILLDPPFIWKSIEQNIVSYLTEEVFSICETIASDCLDDSSSFLPDSWSGSISLSYTLLPQRFYYSMDVRGRFTTG